MIKDCLVARVSGLRSGQSTVYRAEYDLPSLEGGTIRCELLHHDLKQFLMLLVYTRPEIKMIQPDKVIGNMMDKNEFEVLEDRFYCGRQAVHDLNQSEYLRNLLTFV